MKIQGKVSTLERIFPLMAVENGFVISKNADVTALFRVELPELFTISESDYDSIHDTWGKAIRALPTFTVVHKQDWFIKEKYESDKDEDGHLSFLDHSYQAHFNERPYLNHTCYLYITLSNEKRLNGKSDSTVLARSSLMPQTIKDKEQDLANL